VGIEESEPTHAGHDLIPSHPHLDQGDAHSDKAHGHHADSHDPHESPLSMTGVLTILAALAVIGGFIGLPAALGGANPTWFQQWLAPVLLPIEGHAFHFHEASHALEYALMLVSIAVAVLGWFLARRFYKLDPHWATPKRIAAKLAPVYRLLENKYWVDELYNATVIAGTLALCRVLWWFDIWIVDGIVNSVRHLTVIGLGHGSSIFDKYVIDGAVNGVASGARSGSMLMRRVQSGLVQNYALVMGGGIVLIAVVYLFMKP
jgi:NADH-quinone oxidoreductase subunit L